MLVEDIDGQFTCLPLSSYLAYRTTLHLRGIIRIENKTAGVVLLLYRSMLGHLELGIQFQLPYPKKVIVELKKKAEKGSRSN